MKPRVLLLHNYYKQQGGEDAVVKADRALLKREGHPTFLLEESNVTINNPMAKARVAVAAVYSRSARLKVAAQISKVNPDVVHVHNFFPLLSPSVYDACGAAGVPVVQTLHNYRLACPNALFFRGGRVCEDCLGKAIPWPGAWRGCYRQSRVQTLAVTAMLGVHKLRGTWRTRVDAFIALTQFQKEKLVQAGLPTNKITVKPNFVADPGAKTGEGNFALYVGRLSPEKGLGILLDAWKEQALDIPLKIVGSGPLAEQLAARVEQDGLGDTALLVGSKPRAVVLALMKSARFLLFSSEWHETFGLSIIEAFACGLPVIASRIGGIPEIVEDGRTGWLVEPGDADAWARTIKEAWDNPEECARRGREARAEYLAKYTPEKNYEQLMAIYESVINRRKN